MKLSDITVYKRREFYMMSPFTIKISPSNKTQSFLIKLINDPFFIKNLSELRLKYKIPKDGYSTNLLDSYKHKCEFTATPEEMEQFKMIHGIYDIEPLWKKMRKDIKKLVNHYYYASSYIWLFFLLITHNAFIEIDPKEELHLEFGSKKDELIERIRELNDPICAILIKSNVTKTDLKNWIDKNWEITDKEVARGYTSNIDIKYYLDKVMPKQFVERGTLKSLKIDDEIISLINMGRTNTEICEHLIQLFPDEDKVYGQDWVNLHITRLKKRLKKL
jgi:hypothetical protein